MKTVKLFDLDVPCDWDLSLVELPDEIPVEDGQGNQIGKATNFQMRDGSVWADVEMPDEDNRLVGTHMDTPDRQGALRPTHLTAVNPPFSRYSQRPVGFCGSEADWAFRQRFLNQTGKLPTPEEWDRHQEDIMPAHSSSHHHVGRRLIGLAVVALGAVLILILAAALHSS